MPSILSIPTFFILIVTLISCQKSIDIDYREDFLGTYEGQRYGHVFWGGMDSLGNIISGENFDTSQISLKLEKSLDDKHALRIVRLGPTTVEIWGNVTIYPNGKFLRDYGMGSNQDLNGSISADSFSYNYSSNPKLLRTEITIKASRVD